MLQRVIKYCGEEKCGKSRCTIKQLVETKKKQKESHYSQAIQGFSLEWIMSYSCLNTKRGLIVFFLIFLSHSKSVQISLDLFKIDVELLQDLIF